MNCSWWCAVAPGLTELALLGICGWLWARMREPGVWGAGHWVLIVVGLDSVTHIWQLWAQLGRPAGVGWLAHAMVCYAVVYALYRLAEMAPKGKQERPESPQARAVIVAGIQERVRRGCRRC